MRRGRIWRLVHSGVLPFTVIHPEHPDYPKSEAALSATPLADGSSTLVAVTDGPETC